MWPRWLVTWRCTFGPSRRRTQRIVLPCRAPLSSSIARQARPTLVARQCAASHACCRKLSRLAAVLGQARRRMHGRMHGCLCRGARPSARCAPAVILGQLWLEPASTTATLSVCALPQPHISGTLASLARVACAGQMLGDYALAVTWTCEPGRWHSVQWCGEGLESVAVSRC